MLDECSVQQYGQVVIVVGTYVYILYSTYASLSCYTAHLGARCDANVWSGIGIPVCFCEVRGA